MNQPCYQCPDRIVTVKDGEITNCHSSCERYKEMLATHPQRVASAARQRELQTRTYQIDNFYKIKKANNVGSRVKFK